MEYYRHSGRTAPLAVFVTSLCGIVAAVVLGVIYAFVISWIPIIYATFLATLGLGFGVGMAVGYGATLGKMRNNFLVYALGAVCGLLAVYAAWVADPPARSNFLAPFALDTEFLLDWMRLGYEEGFWTIGKVGADGGGGAVKGMPLVSVWVIEAGIIIVLATLTSGGSTSGRPFCEQDDQWTKLQEDVSRVYGWEPTGTAAQQLIGGDLGALDKLIRADADSQQYLRLDVAACPACAESNYLSVKHVYFKPDKNGKLEKKADALMNNLRVTAEEVEAIRNAGRTLSLEELQSLQKTGQVPEEVAEAVRRQNPQAEGTAPAAAPSIGDQLRG